MASRNSPFSKGVNLLKRGSIHVGTIYWAARINIVVPAQHIIQALGPAYSRKASMQERSKPPRTTPMMIDLIRSIIKIIGVVLLNPNFSSITNVEYILNGRVITDFSSKRIPAYKRPVTTGPKFQDLTMVSRRGKPFKNQNMRVTVKSKIDVIKPNFVHAFKYF